MNILAKHIINYQSISPVGTDNFILGQSLGTGWAFDNLKVIPFSLPMTFGSALRYNVYNWLIHNLSYCMNCIDNHKWLICRLPHRVRCEDTFLGDMFDWYQIIGYTAYVACANELVDLGTGWGGGWGYLETMVCILDRVGQI